MPTARTPNHNVSLGAEEINCLVYNYLMDSGFEHAAFVLRAESPLGASPFAKAYVKRGLLVELLAKALLYTEVEAHWKDGAAFPVTCKAPFSLLKKHVCSSVAKQRPNGATGDAPPSRQDPPPVLNGVNGTHEAPKRKASQQQIPEDRSGKRARVDADLPPPQAKPPAATAKPAPIVVPAPAPAAAVVTVNGKEHLTQTPIPPKPTPPKQPVFRQLRGHQGVVYCSSWNLAEPRTFATGSQDGTIRIWDVPPHSDQPVTCLRTLKEDPAPAPADAVTTGEEPKHDIICLDFNRYGTLIAGGSFDHYLRVWKKDGTLGFSHKNHTAPIFNVKFSPSGLFLLTASLDGTAAIFDVRAKKLVREYQYHEGSCLDIDWFDEDTFVSCGSDHKINVFTRVSTVPFRIYRGHDEDVSQVKFCANRKLMASCSDDRTARVWSTRDFKSAASAESVAILRGHEDSVTSLNWIPTRDGKDQTIIATASFDDTARLWDAVTGNCLHVIRGHAHKCYTATFSPDGLYLSTGGGDSTVRITSVKTGKLLFQHKFERSEGAVYDVSWRRTPEGEIRMAACIDSTVALFDVLKLQLPPS
ncbi:WD40 repeat-like protein [Exidia glandulosa HHB12029]|uniref:WD40 repeat-like protein n=1 Tax=Exidia glandulosa HHB12029 TaxID=1314781 RepID=A0A165CF86_EXIGL|nr:WD40 repeat-like protein [Exidia glandulosa HHB12029]